MFPLPQGIDFFSQYYCGWAWLYCENYSMWGCGNHGEHILFRHSLLNVYVLGGARKKDTSWPWIGHYSSLCVLTSIHEYCWTDGKVCIFCLPVNLSLWSCALFIKAFTLTDLSLYYDNGPRRGFLKSPWFPTDIERVSTWFTTTSIFMWFETGQISLWFSHLLPMIYIGLFLSLLSV